MNCTLLYGAVKHKAGAKKSLVCKKEKKVFYEGFPQKIEPNPQKNVNFLTFTKNV